MEDASERPELYAIPVALMQCSPGNIEHGEGQECVVVTFGKRDLSIESHVYRLDDARELVVKLLAALMTYEDELAQRLLDEHFVTDDEGQHVWPERANEDE